MMPMKMKHPVALPLTLSVGLLLNLVQHTTEEQELQAAKATISKKEKELGVIMKAIISKNCQSIHT